MASDKFRRELRQEVEQWRSQGIIDATQAQQLAERYEFARLDGMARDRFVLVVLGIGGVLLGLGVITFVAANWQAIPRDFKLLLLLTWFVGVNGLGFYLWQPRGQLGDRMETGRQRLGQALLLFGALILGANMALTGQMFHIGGSSADLFVVWGLAVLAMAYGLRLTSLGVLAILLTGVGYWIGVSGWDWNNPPSDAVRGVVYWMPLIAAGAFIPLAYWCRAASQIPQGSRVVFGMGAIVTMGALQQPLSRLAETFSSYFNSMGIWMAMMFILPVAVLWSYDDRLWQRLFSRFRGEAGELPIFRPIAQGLGVFYLMLLTYSSSFHTSWSYSRTWETRSADLQRLLADGLPVLLNPSLIFFAVLVVVQWLYLMRPGRLGRWGLSQNDGMILGFLGVLGAVTFWHWTIAPIEAIATFVANALLFVLAVALMRDGLAEGKRLIFWSGLSLVALQIFSRLLEYETALLLKSLVFVLCGVGVIVIGLWFERYVRTLRISSED
jgi:uncharacterized membrane protein